MTIKYLEDNRDNDGYLIDNRYKERGVNGMAYDDVLDYLPPRLPDNKEYMQRYLSFKSLLLNEDYY